MHNWQIKQMERNISDNGVVRVYWKCRIDVDDPIKETFYTASRAGTIDFIPNPSSSSFIAFDNLTEETVLGWVKGSLDVEAIEADVTLQIEVQKTPIVTSGIPWR
jgi:hypothetical protein